MTVFSSLCNPVLYEWRIYMSSLPENVFENLNLYSYIYISNLSYVRCVIQRLCVNKLHLCRLSLTCVCSDQSILPRKMLGSLPSTYLNLYILDIYFEYMLLFNSIRMKVTRGCSSTFSNLYLSVFKPSAVIRCPEFLSKFILK